MPSPQIGIFVATMTGTAEMCAEEIQSSLHAAGLQTECHLMDGLDAEALRPFDFVVVVSSTYGHGDIPDNGQALFEAIEQASSLAGLGFAVFGLGDSTYATTFCEAGRKWDALLAEKGGSRFAPLIQHDASSGTLAEDIAGAWAAEWAGQLKQAA
jgi:MioC protein